MRLCAEVLFWHVSPEHLIQIWTPLQGLHRIKVLWWLWFCGSGLPFVTRRWRWLICSGSPDTLSAVITSFMPINQAGPERKDDRRFIYLRGPSVRASCNCLPLAAAASIARRSSVRVPPSTIASRGRPGVASDGGCCLPWPTPDGWAKRRPSTAPT